MLRRRADAISASPLDAPAAVRRGRRRIAATLALTTVTAAAVLIGAVAGVTSLLRATPTPALPDEEQILPTDVESWTRAPTPLDGPATIGTVGDDGNRVHSITAGGPGLVAVGSKGWAGAVWTSSNGQEWTLVEHVEQTTQTTAFLDVTMGGPGLVAVALGNHGWSTQTGDDAPIWTSPDGVTWTRAPSDDVFRGAWLRAVTAGGPGLVAVGSDVDGTQVWISTDGVTWQKASVPTMPTGVAIDGDHAEAWLQDVAATDDRLVAFGQIGFGHLDEDGSGIVRYEQVVWTSTDGLNWTELRAGSTFPPGGEVRSVVAGPAGFVAVGGFVRDDLWIWISRDGLDWHLVPQQDAFVSRSSGGGDVSDDLYFEIHQVAAGPSGYVAVGGDAWCVYGSPFLCSPAEAAIWTSADGESWVRVSSAPVFRLGRTTRVSTSAVAAWGSRFVVVAAYGEGTAVWISEASESGSGSSEQEPAGGA
jgi:hypothetical protein